MLTATPYEFIVAHCIVFQDPDGNGVGKWTDDRVRALVIKNYKEVASDKFTDHQCRKAIKILQEAGCITKDNKILPEMTIYSRNMQYDSYMMEVYKWCLNAFPDINFDFETLDKKRVYDMKKREFWGPFA